jgi:hypothetical protein
MQFLSHFNIIEYFFNFLLAETLSFTFLTNTESRALFGEFWYSGAQCATIDSVENFNLGYRSPLTKQTLARQIRHLISCRPFMAYPASI